MAMVEVHRYKVWNATTGAWDFPTEKLTAQAIAELHGEIIPDTFETVFQSMLDEEGRYVPWKNFGA
jgi:hypothetical protein